MELAVGDEIVYGTHGLGRVVERKTTVSPAGEEQDVVVLELAGGLKVTLSHDRALQHLRSVVGGEEIERVQAALREDRTLGTGPWLSRRPALLAKLAGGDAVALAEIVGEGAQREQVLQAEGKRRQMSSGEQELVDRARRLLTEEISLARGVTHDEAVHWIETQLLRADD